MAKVKWGLSNESEPADGDGSFYSGPVPPVSNYACTLKFLRMGLDKNGTNRISGPCEISEPEGSRAAKYNGYAIWVGQSFTDHPRSKAYMMSLCKALGISWRDLLTRTITDKAKWSKEDPAEITKIGGVKVDNLELIVVAKNGKDQDGNRRLEIASFLPEGWDPEDDEDDDDEESDDDDEEESDDDDDEDDEDDEEDEEPAPPVRKSSARKSTPAKKSAAPAKKASTKRRRATAEDDDPPF